MMPHSTQHTLFSSPPQHGANTRWIRERYPDAPTPIIDLSTGITPYPYPHLVWEKDAPHRLPDPQEILCAETNCRRYYDTPSGVEAVLAPGLQSVIFALACLTPNRKVAILSPTYGEHARVWRALGHDVSEIATLDDIPAQTDVVILCNPNNPTGRIYDRIALRQWIEHTPHGLVIIDESFADLSPECSMTPVMNHPSLVVLRSFGKFFGMAGMRASVALCQGNIAAWLRLATGPWPISTLACQLIPTMLADIQWQKHSRQLLQEESIRWHGLLKKYFKPIGGISLFTMVETDQAGAWVQHLAAQGIAVRPFDDYPSWLRFGLPHRDNLPRIMQALESFGS